MAGNTGVARQGHLWRIVGWTFAAFLLLLPLVAMQFTDEVRWSPSDFVFAAFLLLGVGVPFELAVRRSSDTMYRVAFGMALVAGFLLTWMNGAVGLIIPNGGDLNGLYFLVIVVAIIGSLVARFRPLGMAGTLVAMALTQAAIAVVALINGSRSVFDVLALNSFFIVMFLSSAQLFRRAAVKRSDPAAS